MSDSETESRPPAPIIHPQLDYEQTVVKLLRRMTSEQNQIDQAVLRHFVGLSPSYFILDSTSAGLIAGVHTWQMGFHHLVDVMIALHARKELDLETVNEASRACSECWSVAAGWRIDEGKECIRNVANRLKTILDENGVEYRGLKVWAPGPTR